jgi:hypothetical protein
MDASSFVGSWASLQLARPMWFVRARRIQVPSDDLGPYRFQSTAAYSSGPRIPRLALAARVQLAKRLGLAKELFDRMESDGSVVVPSLFS